MKKNNFFLFLGLSFFTASFLIHVMHTSHWPAQQHFHPGSFTVGVNTPLIDRCFQVAKDPLSSLKDFQDLFEGGPIDVNNAYSTSGENFFMTVIKSGKVDCARFLLSLGADLKKVRSHIPSAGVGSLAARPLSHGAWGTEQVKVEHILNYDLFKKNQEMYALLLNSLSEEEKQLILRRTFASSGTVNHEDLVKQLVSLGLDLSLMPFDDLSNQRVSCLDQSFFSQNGFDVAGYQQFQNNKFLKSLEELWANISTTKSKFVNIVHKFGFSNLHDFVKHRLRGYDLNASINENGDTALLFLIKKMSSNQEESENCWSVINSLLELGANPNQFNNQRENVYFFLKDPNFKEIYCFSSASVQKKLKKLCLSPEPE